MYRIRPLHYIPPVFSALILISLTAKSATEINPNAGLTLLYTDNAGKVADNKEEDLLVITRVGASVDTNSGPYRLEASTSLKHTNYTHDTFDDQHYFNLSAIAGWEMLKDRLDWKLQNFFTQQSIDSLNPDTPDNIQDSNILTFGPDIHYRLTGLQSLTISPQYRKFSYEIQNFDNQQNLLDVIWNYQQFRTVNVGVRGGINEVDYDDPLITDNSFRSLHFTLSAVRPYYNYNLEIGSTHVDRNDAGNVRGLTGNLRWLYNMSAFSDLRVYFASEITDANDNLLNSSIDPDQGGFSYQQISSEVLRDSIFRLSHHKKEDDTLSSIFWIELRDQDYEFVLFDRKIQEAGLDFNYPLTNTLYAGINTEYSRIELTDAGREDNQFSIGANINYRFSRKLLGTVALKYYDTDSSVATMSYKDVNILFSLIYGYESYFFIPED